MTRILSLFGVVMLWASLACAQSGNTMRAADSGHPTFDTQDEWLYNAATNPLPACNPPVGRVSTKWVSDQSASSCVNDSPYLSGGNSTCPVVCRSAAVGWTVIGSNPGAFAACPATSTTRTTTLTLTSANSGQMISGYSISTTTGPCIKVTGATNITISGNLIGPCGGTAGSTQSPSTDSNGIELSGVSTSKIVDNYVHTETDCNTGGSSPVFTHEGILDQSGSHNLIQGNIVLAGNDGISTGSAFPSPTTTGDTLKGNFVINATSSCYTGQGNDLNVYSQNPVVTLNYIVNCVLSGGGTGTGLNCSAVPGLSATPPHGGRNGGDAIALGSYDTNYLTNTVSATSNYVVGETGDSDTCILTWHGAHGATISNNIGIDCGGPSGASFDAVAGSGTVTNNKSFNNIETTTSGPCCLSPFEDFLQSASGDTNFVWSVTNNVDDVIFANGTHGTEYCGGGACPGTGVTESGNVFGSGAFPNTGLTNSSTPSQIESVLGAPPLIPPNPYGCIAQSMYTNRPN